MQSYRTGNLSLEKQAVLRDLDHVAVVPLDYFNTAVLPPLHSRIDIGVIESRLYGSGVLSMESDRWAAFPQDPEKEASHEDTVFGPLSLVFDAIVQAVEESTGTASKLSFVQRPATPPTSERTNISCPDAYLLLVNKKSVGKNVKCPVHCWEDIAVSFGFKKRDGRSGNERRDNEGKVIWNLHQIMRSDPCRRSTFGVTVENTQMRLWFTCRSVTVVSEPFNFITSCDQMIRLFCSLAFAEDHELGWDPTIQRVLVDGGIQYDISLQSPEGLISVYRTTRIISDFGAEALRGPATRVFEAYPRPNAKGSPPSTPKLIVIKDSWRDWDRKREDEIHAEIFSDLEKAKGTEAAKADMKYFLTIREAADVTVDGKKDDTHLLLHYSPLPQDCGWHTISADPALSRTRHTSSVGYPPSDNSCRDTPKPVKTQHRIHCRLVFEEVCTTLFEIANLDDAFETLQDGFQGLRVLHSVNWIHRDISPGNIMRIDKMGKIADLEYAKRMGSDQSHEVRTGTIDFMACEIEVQQYIFRNHSHGGPLRRFRADIVDSPQQSPKIPFTYNPLHDLESLWWIQAWLLHFYVDQEGRDRSTEQSANYHSLFPGYLLRGSRILSLQSPMEFDILPESFQRPGWVVEEMRRCLVAAYSTCERTLPPKFQDHLDEIATFFTEAMQTAIVVSKNVILHIPGKRKEPDQGGEESQPTKRRKV